jgi:lipid-A-disaccharide synthase-like uncharacterized protein
MFMIQFLCLQKKKKKFLPTRNYNVIVMQALLTFLYVSKTSEVTYAISFRPSIFYKDTSCYKLFWCERKNERVNDVI